VVVGAAVAAVGGWVVVAAAVAAVVGWVVVGAAVAVVGADADRDPTAEEARVDVEVPHPAAVDIASTPKRTALRRTFAG
jgi:hypothetical protein